MESRGGWRRACARTPPRRGRRRRGSRAGCRANCRKQNERRSPSVALAGLPGRLLGSVALLPLRLVLLVFAHRRLLLVAGILLLVARLLFRFNRLRAGHAFELRAIGNGAAAVAEDPVAGLQFGENLDAAVL